MRIQQTTDRNQRPATYGIERGTPWLEYSEGKPGLNEVRTALYGHTQSGKQRIADEIIRLGIRITLVHLEVLILDRNAA